MNETGEFKCECNEGFDGKRCDEKCILTCAINELCTTGINEITGTKKWICKPKLPECNANPCCDSSLETALCCDHGACSNPNFIFNGTNADQCQCLCTDNWTGLI